MNVYDFDKTIYNGDSTIDFYIYCLFKQPRILKVLPIQLKAIIFYLLKKIDKTKCKEEFYSFLKGLKNVDIILTQFWKIHKKKIKKWYLECKDKDDLIISASPFFLLKPICEYLNTSLIASEVNKLTGDYHGLNCYGQEKVRRFLIEYPNSVIENFYTDSLSDLPLIKASKKSYIVKGTKIIAFDHSFIRKWR